MSSTTGFVWTSRGGARDEMIRILEETPRRPKDARGLRYAPTHIRTAAAAILGAIGLDADLPAIARLLLDPEEEESVRRVAARALERLGASLPHDDLARVLEERVLDDLLRGDPAFAPATAVTHERFFATSLLPLVRTEDEQRLALEKLARLPLEDRSRLARGHHEGCAILTRGFEAWAAEKGGEEEPDRCSPPSAAYARAARRAWNEGCMRAAKLLPCKLVPHEGEGEASLLSRAAASPDPVLRFLALEVLHEADDDVGPPEDDSEEEAPPLPWVRTLAEDANPAVRIRAQGILAWTDPDHVAILRREAVESKDVAIRAWALRALTGVHAEEHVDLFARAFPGDDARLGPHHQPALEEGARGLAIAGHPGAMTALVRGLLSLGARLEGTGKERLLHHLAWAASEAGDPPPQRFSRCGLPWFRHCEIADLPGFGYTAVTDRAWREERERSGLPVARRSLWKPPPELPEDPRFPLASFAWTTPDDVRAQLARFISSVPRAYGAWRPNPSSPCRRPSRERAILLLAMLADESVAELLRAVADDADESDHVRETARRAVRLARERTGGTPSLDLVEYDDWWSVDRLVRSSERPEALSRAWRAIEELDAYGRTQLVRSLCGCEREGPPSPLADRLYSLWAERDLPSLLVAEDDGMMNLDSVLANTFARSESRAALVARVPDMDVDHLRRTLERLSLGDADALLRHHPTKRDEAIAALAVPAPLLLEALPREALLDLIERRAREVEAEFLAGRYRVSVFTDMVPAIDAAQAVAGGESRILGALASPELRGKVRQWMLPGRPRDGSDPAHQREAALALLPSADRDPTVLPAIVSALRCAARSPERADRALLLSGVGLPHAGARHFGIRGLSRLGEAGPDWRVRLARLADEDHPAVRVAACAALARLGDAARLGELRHAAVHAPHVIGRAAALGALGELDLEAHADLAERAILEDHERGPHCDRYAYAPPAVVEAIATLDALDTPRARTALLRAGLLHLGNECDGSLVSIAARIGAGERTDGERRSWGGWDGQDRWIEDGDDRWRV